MGIGDWGLGPIPNPQSPIPNANNIPFIYSKNKKSIIKKIFNITKNNKINTTPNNNTNFTTTTDNNTNNNSTNNLLGKKRRIYKKKELIFNIIQKPKINLSVENLLVLNTEEKEDHIQEKEEQTIEKECKNNDNDKIIPKENMSSDIINNTNTNNNTNTFSSINSIYY